MSLANPRSERAGAWWMLLACAAFAPMAACVKLALQQHSLGEVLMVRGLVGATVFSLLAIWAGVSLCTSFAARHVQRSAIGILAVGSWFYALSVLPLASAYMLYHMSSLWLAAAVLGGSVLAAWRSPPGKPPSPADDTRAAPGKNAADWSMATVTTRSILKETQLSPGERAKRIFMRQWPLALALVIGFVGVGLVLAPGLQSAQPLAYAVGISAGGVAAWAVSTVARLGRLGEPDVRIGFWFMVSTAAVGLLWSTGHWISQRGIHWSWASSQYLIYAALLAALGQWAMTRAFSTGSPLLAANLQYVGVVFATAIGVGFFGETLSLPSMLGLLIIVASAVIAARIRARQDAA
jgi:uncharacterized membrane protein